MPAIDAGRAEVGARPLRADARRNRARVLEAAREVFAEQGGEAQVDDVARRAHVGVGTVYRHFPTKEALVAALVEDHFRLLTRWAQEALEAPDAWDAFVELLWRSGERMADDRALSEIMIDAKRQASLDVADLQLATHRLMVRAQEEGRLRADAQVGDVPMIMCGVGGAMRLGDWRRYLAIAVDGLRAPAATTPLAVSAATPVDGPGAHRP